MITILMRGGPNHTIPDADYVEYERQPEIWIFKQTGETNREDEDEIVAVFLAKELIGWIRGEVPTPQSVSLGQFSTHSGEESSHGRSPGN